MIMIMMWLMMMVRRARICGERGQERGEREAARGRRGSNEKFQMRRTNGEYEGLGCCSRKHPAVWLGCCPSQLEHRDTCLGAVPVSGYRLLKPGSGADQARTWPCSCQRCAGATATRMQTRAAICACLAAPRGSHGDLIAAPPAPELLTLIPLNRLIPMRECIP
jgi:hypothetical protein